MYRRLRRIFDAPTAVLKTILRMTRGMRSQFAAIDKNWMLLAPF